MTIEVVDSDPKEMPHAVGVLGEVCTIRVVRGNHGMVLRLTIDEAQSLREKLERWLFSEGGL